jgi:hypothetical protein
MTANDTPPDQVKLPRQTRGKRPHFFDDPSLDQVMTFLIEVAVMRERLDTVERLLERDGKVTRASIESFRADAQVEAERSTWRDGYIKRVMRMHPSGSHRDSEP